MFGFVCELGDVWWLDKETVRNELCIALFSTVQEEELKRQQQEQFALELEEKQRSLELQLEEAQVCRRRLQDALQVPSGMSSLQETPPSPPSPPQDGVSEPSNHSEVGFFFFKSRDLVKQLYYFGVFEWETLALFLTR